MENQMKQDTLYFAKIRPTAKIPEREEGNAGYDIYADFIDPEITIPAHATRTIPTGIASAMSKGWYLQVEERGSTGSKGIKKSAGVIDSSYRGEIFIAITNATNETLVISKHVNQTESKDGVLYYPYEKAIAQLVLHKVHNEVQVEEINFNDLQQFPSTRGAGALGSSGK